ncbi:MAG: NFACT family protein [Kyrpidia sp.]|nr:NFACT family protein [Kyrpidia sp.]
MALDGLTLAGIAMELQILVGGKVERIYQPEARDLDIRIRTAGQSVRILASADPSAPRVHLIHGRRSPAPSEPPAFCALARRRLEGGRIRYIRQVGLERTLRVGIESRNEIGDPQWYDLVVEVMGRHSNVILVAHEDPALRDEEGPARGRVIDAVARVTPGMSRHRVVLPGQPYVPPPEQHKIDPRRETRASFFAWAASCDPSPAPGHLVARYQGIGPAAAEELVRRARALHPAPTPASESPPSPEALWQVLSGVAADLLAGRFEPCVAYDNSGAPKAVSALFLRHLALCARVVPFGTVNEAVESFYADRSVRPPSGESGALAAAVRNALEGLEHRIARCQAQLRQAEEADQLRQWGELLTAYLHAVPRGVREVSLPDPYSETGGPVTIPLAPELSAAENAQALFRRYQKLKRTRQVATEYVERARRDVEYLESVLVALEHAEGDELEEIRDELAQQGILRPRRRAEKQRGIRDEGGAPMHFVSSDGIDIFVGKNNRQNDRLTTKIAQNRIPGFMPKTFRAPTW